MDVAGKTYRVTHPAAADALIDESDFDRDERLPYWAELWPSAIALVRHLAGRDLAGKRVVELGCGVGLPSIVALERGARVLAADHYDAALVFARHNARRNLGREPETLPLDWHAPGDLTALGSFDLVIAADVLYEGRNVPALATLVPALLAHDGEAIVADPRRDSAPRFLASMQRNGFRVATDDAIVGRAGRDVRVRVHRFWRGF